MQASAYAAVRVWPRLDMDLKALLKNIQISTTIFHAANDNEISFKSSIQAHSGIIKSKLIRFESGGHWIVF